MSPDDRDEFAEYMRELRTDANLSPFELVFACIEQNPFQCYFSWNELSTFTGLSVDDLYEIVGNHSDNLLVQYPPNLKKGYVTLKKYGEAGYLLDSPDISYKLPRSANEKAVFVNSNKPSQMTSLTTDVDAFFVRALQQAAFEARSICERSKPSIRHDAGQRVGHFSTCLRRQFQHNVNPDLNEIINQIISSLIWADILELKNRNKFSKFSLTVLGGRDILTALESWIRQASPKEDLRLSIEQDMASVRDALNEMSSVIGEAARINNKSEDVIHNLVAVLEKVS